jgi:hypothetical protein
MNSPDEEVKRSNGDAARRAVLEMAEGSAAARSLERITRCAPEDVVALMQLGDAIRAQVWSESEKIWLLNG